MRANNIHIQIYKRLRAAYGPRHWWPGRNPWEVMVGAILTQNTSWKNVEVAIANLRGAGLLGIKKLATAKATRLHILIRPARYFRSKTRCLQGLSKHVLKNHSGSLTKMFLSPKGELREELLSLKGIGPETADSILVYAAKKRSFVVDAYTRRIYSRIGLVPPDASYGEIQVAFEKNIPRRLAFYNDYHAQIVALGHSACRPRPLCGQCPLLGSIPPPKKKSCLHGGI